MPVLAIGAVDLVLLFVAFAALIVLLSFHVFGKVIERVFGRIGDVIAGSFFGQIPVIGGIFRYATGTGQLFGTAMSRFLARVVLDMARGLDLAVSPIAHLIWAAGNGAWHLVFQTGAAISNAKTWAVYAYDAALNAGIGAANLVGEAVSHLTASINAALQYSLTFAEGLFATAERDIATVASDVVSEANRVLGEAEAYAAARIAGVEAQISGVASDVISEGSRVLGEAEGYAAGLAAGLSQEISGVASDVISEANKVLGEARTYADTAAGAAAGVAGAGVLAQVLPRLGILEAEATTCLEPLCDTVTPNAKQLGEMGKLLKGVDGLFDAALLATLLVEAVRDPEGAATAVVDLTGWLTSLAAELAAAAGVAL